MTRCITNTKALWQCELNDMVYTAKGLGYVCFYRWVFVIFTGVCLFVFTGEDVKLVSYDGTAAGLIKSFVDRFPANHIEILAELWEREKPYF